MPTSERIELTSSAATAIEVGQQRRQPRGEHRLAGAGRPEQVDVVPAGRGDLHRLHRIRVADDVGEVAGSRRAAPRARPASAARPARASSSAPWKIAASRSDAIGTTRSSGTSAASGALPVGTSTVPNPARAAASAAGRIPVTGRSRPSSPSSPRCTTSADRLRRDLAVGGVGRHRDAEVEPRAVLRQRRGREVDRQLARGQRDAGVGRRRAHPVARLAERRIRQPDQHEVRQLRRDVRLDLDHGSVDAEQRDGVRASDRHQKTRSR